MNIGLHSEMHRERHSEVLEGFRVYSTWGLKFSSACTVESAEAVTTVLLV
jgi:hypothetical protein